MFVRFSKSHWRLKVYIVENARHDGKVKQALVAYLGSVDSRVLMLNGDDERERQSIAGRVAFWDRAGPKLKQLVNRIGGDEGVKRLRMAVHARIPWPMEPERRRLEALEAEREAKLWHSMYGQTGKMIEANEALAAKAAADITVLRGQGLQEITWANQSAAKARALREGK